MLRLLRDLWFETLTKRNPKTGIRDIIEHLPARLLVQAGQVENQRPELTAYLLWSQSHPDFGKDLVSTLRGIVRGFCDLCTEIHAAVRWGNCYNASDRLSIVGLDDDFTGFWPEI